MTPSSFARRLFENLWASYGRKVPYALMYEKMVTEKGGRFVNDHVAFRTLHVEGDEDTGIPFIARIFLALGFERQENKPLVFPDQHLLAFSYRHPDVNLPKVFVSQLLIDELQEKARGILGEFAKQRRDLLGQEIVRQLRRLERLTVIQTDNVLQKLLAFFKKSPWVRLAKEDELRRVNEQSQYGAWVMLFGNEVNHFTGSVNHIGAESLTDIEEVMAALTAKRVPMKEEIEGERGSKLRQTSTKAAEAFVKVLDLKGDEMKIKWPYAYFEIAERKVDVETGKLFQGFIPQQARKLFEMTKRTR